MKQLRSVLWMLGGAFATFGACAVHVEDGAKVAGDDSGASDVLGLELGVSDAVAGPTDPAPTKVTKACDKGTIALHYAEADAPGRTKEDLSRSTAMTCTTTASPIKPPGYDCFAVALVWVKDGSIAVTCDLDQAVTFVIPPPL